MPPRILLRRRREEFRRRQRSADGVAEIARVQLQRVHGLRRERRLGLPSRQLRVGAPRRARPHGRRRQAAAHPPAKGGGFFFF